MVKKKPTGTAKKNRFTHKKETPKKTNPSKVEVEPKESRCLLKPSKIVEASWITLKGGVAKEVTGRIVSYVGVQTAMYLWLHSIHKAADPKNDIITRIKPQFVDSVFVRYEDKKQTMRGAVIPFMPEQRLLSKLLTAPEEKVDLKSTQIANFSKFASCHSRPKKWLLEVQAHNKKLLADNPTLPRKTLPGQPWGVTQL